MLQRSNGVLWRPRRRVSRAEDCRYHGAMNYEQVALVILLCAMVGLFLLGRWRHDFVAVSALLGAVALGVVPADQAFAGFGHPAVITVAAILILSGVLQSSGAADRLVRACVPQSLGASATTAALVLLATLISGFMNNVGALALLMPVALQVAARQGVPPGRLLMPLSFGSILGGMTTMIGTPPNLIVAGFRAEAGLGSYGIFDFAPVGGAVALVGIVFLLLAARYLVPVRERAGAESFETAAYLTEARVAEKSKAVGLRLSEVEEMLDEAGAQIVGLVRSDTRILAPNPARKVRAGDILIIEAEPETLSAVLLSLGLELVGREPRATRSESAADGDRTVDDPTDERESAGDGAAEEVVLVEMAVLPHSGLVGRSVSAIGLRSRLGINLLAISRRGHRNVGRLRSMHLASGDVVLLQGANDALNEFASRFRCVPLAARALQLPMRRDALIAGGVMAGGVAAAAFGLLPAAIAFTAAALACMVLGLVSARNFYDAVDWPVVVLLGALIPVALAVERSGTAALLANFLVEEVARNEAVVALALLLVVTMSLSDFMNNAATAAVMAPIAISTAQKLGASPDPMLMAVAVGASCAFLTPIGHQNNTLILGPGGFRFGDYWRLGLPLEVIVVLVAVPVILVVWPL